MTIARAVCVAVWMREIWMRPSALVVVEGSRWVPRLLVLRMVMVCGVMVARYPNVWRSLINLCDCMDASSVKVLEGSWIVRMSSLRLRRY